MRIIPNALYNSRPLKLLLKAFRGITLTVMDIDQVRQRFLSPLSELQQRILQLLDTLDEIYLSLIG